MGACASQTRSRSSARLGRGSGWVPWRRQADRRGLDAVDADTLLPPEPSRWSQGCWSQGDGIERADLLVPGRGSCLSRGDVEAKASCWWPPRAGDSVFVASTIGSVSWLAWGQTCVGSYIHVTILLGRHEVVQWVPFLFSTWTTVKDFWDAKAPVFSVLMGLGSGAGPFLAPTCVLVLFFAARLPRVAASSTLERRRRRALALVFHAYAFQRSLDLASYVFCIGLRVDARLLSDVVRVATRRPSPDTHESVRGARRERWRERESAVPPSARERQNRTARPNPQAELRAYPAFGVLVSEIGLVFTFCLATYAVLSQPDPTPVAGDGGDGDSVRSSLTESVKSESTVKSALHEERQLAESPPVGLGRPRPPAWLVAAAVANVPLLSCAMNIEFVRLTCSEIISDFVPVKVRTFSILQLAAAPLDDGRPRAGGAAAKSGSTQSEAVSYAFAIWFGFYFVVCPLLDVFSVASLAVLERLDLRHPKERLKALCTVLRGLSNLEVLLIVAMAMAKELGEITTWIMRAAAPDAICNDLHCYKVTADLLPVGTTLLAVAVFGHVAIYLALVGGAPGA